MPEMDGEEATRRLRENLHLRTPIVAVTANVTNPQRYFDVGFDSLLSKVQF